MPQPDPQHVGVGNRTFQTGAIQILERYLRHPLQARQSLRRKPVPLRDQNALHALA